jgi:hypothetical protein
VSFGILGIDSVGVAQKEFFHAFLVASFDQGRQGCRVFPFLLLGGGSSILDILAFHRRKMQALRVWAEYRFSNPTAASYPILARAIVLEVPKITTDY